VLDQAKGMRTAEQSALMMDAQNLQAARLKPALVAALQADAANADLARILEAWDGRDDKDLAAPLIYHSLYERLVYETYVDEMGEKLARDWLGQWYAWQERFDELVKTPDSPWFDDVRTPQKETLPDLVKRVAATVRVELQARHGADPAKWKWGDEHRIAFVSPLRRSGTGRDFLGYAEAPMSGSGATLLRALNPFMGGFEVNFFASMRLVADMGDDEKIEAVVSGGVVDRQFHPHQKDQLPAWSEGRLLKWWFAPAQVEAHAVKRQALVPR
jgi:penicillin amidase